MAQSLAKRWPQMQPHEIESLIQSAANLHSKDILNHTFNACTLNKFRRVLPRLQWGASVMLKAHSPRTTNIKFHDKKTSDSMRFQ